MNIQTKFAPGTKVIVVTQDDRYPEVIKVRKDEVAYVTIDIIDGEIVVSYCLEWDHEDYTEDELLDLNDYAALLDILKRKLL